MLDNATTVLSQADLSNWQSLSHETLQQILSQNDDRLPRLNRSTMNKPAFVRYRGMVQDMRDPEYHRESPNGEFTERQPLLLVPIPFTSPWTRGEQGSMDTAESTMEEVKESKKREREEESAGAGSSKKQSTGSPKAAREFSSCSSQHRSKDVWPAGCMGSNPMETPVLAHFYYELSKGPTLRLNDIVEVIGVVEPVESFAGENAQPDQNAMVVDGDDFFEEEQLPTQVPCLRVACHRKIDLEDLSIDHSESVMEDYQLDIDEVKSIFAATLGSEAAAETLLLSLFSKAERERVSPNDDLEAPMKTPHDGTLGCASLNLVLPTVESCNAAARHLQSLLETVFPVVGRIDLNQKGIAPPGKAARYMEPSPLQLPKGSVLIVVENRMDGKLSTEEVETLHALQSMTRTHSVPYRFDGGMSFNFEADYRVVVLSAKKRTTLLPCTVKMTLQQELTSSSEISPARARQIQSLFVKRCQSTNIRLGMPVLEVAQKDFIERRRQARTSGGKAIEEEDFHRWLTLTRLYARSQGRCSTIIDDWKNALRVDDAMRTI